MKKSIYNLEVGDLCYDTVNLKKYRIAEINVETVNNESVFTFKLKNVDTGLTKKYSEENLTHHCMYIPNTNDVTKYHSIFIPKQKLQIGDKIIVSKTIPKNIGGSLTPIWTSSMNEFLGSTLTVKSINRCYIHVEENIYVWFVDWFTISSKLNDFLKKVGDHT